MQVVGRRCCLPPARATTSWSWGTWSRFARRHADGRQCPPRSPRRRGPRCSSADERLLSYRRGLLGNTGPARAVEAEAYSRRLSKAHRRGLRRQVPAILPTRSATRRWASVRGCGAAHPLLDVDPDTTAPGSHRVRAATPGGHDQPIGRRPGRHLALDARVRAMLGQPGLQRLGAPSPPRPRRGTPSQLDWRDRSACQLTSSGRRSRPCGRGNVAAEARASLAPTSWLGCSTAFCGRHIKSDGTMGSAATYRRRVHTGECEAWGRRAALLGRRGRSGRAPSPRS